MLVSHTRAEQPERFRGVEGRTHPVLLGIGQQAASCERLRTREKPTWRTREGRRGGEVQAARQEAIAVLGLHQRPDVGVGQRDREAIPAADEL